jgi:hypothetical protein
LVNSTRLNEHPGSRKVGYVGDEPGDIASCHGESVGKGFLGILQREEGVRCGEFPCPGRRCVFIEILLGPLPSLADVASASDSSGLPLMLHSGSLTDVVCSQSICECDSARGFPVDGSRRGRRACWSDTPRIYRRFCIFCRQHRHFP